ncbi:hypothetical protein NQ318_007832 [Aromia moschata]|uniref:Thyroglobulin type-1 domain-containing protein n=1 Tax=Aromia moschata TaxID=1265417 RepID=A0AAV8YZ17_9CUCU|nr:hypothetical protein NQ318_007832 [Aromia moschata]
MYFDLTHVLSDIEFLQVHYKYLDNEAHMRKKQRQSDRLNSFMMKYKATLDKTGTGGSINGGKLIQPSSKSDVYTFTPQDFKYENKHYKYIKYTKYNKSIITYINYSPCNRNDSFNRSCTKKTVLCLKTQLADYDNNKLLYAEDKERLRGYNEVTDNKMYSNSIGPLDPAVSPAKQCSPVALQAMGNRLLDWFSVVMADSSKRRRPRNKSKGNPNITLLSKLAEHTELKFLLQPIPAILRGCKQVLMHGREYKKEGDVKANLKETNDSRWAEKGSSILRTTTPTNPHFPQTCKGEVRWMFQHLDINGDTRLSLKELYDLEHDQSEVCLKPFLQQCDIDRDVIVTPSEWCRCFQRTERPCAAVKRKITPDLLGIFVPDCDSQGYYKPVQCHSAINMCWCVDKHGVEFANTRTHAKPNCETIINKLNLMSKPITSNSADNSSDDEDDDIEQDIEGSADHPGDY